MAFSAYLFVEPPVSSLQFDLNIGAGANILSVLPPSLQKSLETNRLPNGLLRVLVFGLNQAVFGGMFATSDTPINSVSDIVGSLPDGSNANANVGWVSQPQGVTFSVDK